MRTLLLEVWAGYYSERKEMSEIQMTNSLPISQIQRTNSLPIHLGSSSGNPQPQLLDNVHENAPLQQFSSSGNSHPQIEEFQRREMPMSHTHISNLSGNPHLQHQENLGSSNGNSHHPHRDENLHGDAPFPRKIIAIYGSALGTVVTLSAAMYNAKRLDPFDAYPVSNTLSILALLICFCASMVGQNYTRLPLMIRHILVFVGAFTGTMALTELTSVLLYSRLGWPAYLLCSFPLIGLMFKPLKQLFNRFVAKIWRPSSNRTQEPILPY